METDHPLDNNANRGSHAPSAPPVPSNLAVNAPFRVGAPLNRPASSTKPATQTNTPVSSAQPSTPVKVEDSAGGERSIGDTGQSVPPKQPGKGTSTGHHWWRRWYTFVGIPVLIILVAGIAFAVPSSRYAILGHFVKRSFTVQLTDDKTDTPVSGATITLAGVHATTNNTGDAQLMVPVGPSELTVTKKYYQDLKQLVVVHLSAKQNTAKLSMIATGRQVPIKVVNKLTGSAIPNAQLQVVGTDAKTDSNGQATIVLPTTAPTQKVSVSADGYNDFAGDIQVTSDVVSANTFQLVPAGKVYFLSNQSGKIDIVSANLDGSNRTTVIAGSGNEDPNSTLLLNSSDWKFLALISKRDGGDHAKLFMFATSDPSQQLKVIDSSATTLSPVGWSGHSFVYSSSDSTIPSWQPGATTVKSYNADSGATATLVSSSATGTSSTDATYQNIGEAALSGGSLFYVATWYNNQGSLGVSGQQNALMSVKLDGSGSKTLKGVDASQYYISNLVQANPTQFYFAVFSIDNSTTNFYRLDANGSITQSSIITADSVSKTYPTYYLSPSGNATFWSESRDGKNAMLIGDANGNNGNVIASLGGYTPYGWFTDNYVLLQKGGSELYVLPVSGGTPTKIADYYKPSAGYGVF